MYLFMNDNGNLIPTYHLTYLDGPMYRVIVSYEDEEREDIHYVDETKIFKVDLKDLMRKLIESNNIRDIPGSSKELILKPLKGFPMPFLIQYGSIINATSKTYTLTQFIFPDNIMSNRDIIAVSNSNPFYNQVTVMPRKGWPRLVTPRCNTQLHRMVLRHLRRNGPATAYTIAKELKRPLTSITGRISELSQIGSIVCYDYDYSSGHRRTLWYISPRDEMEALNE